MTQMTMPHYDIIAALSEQETSLLSGLLFDVRIHRKNRRHAVLATACFPAGFINTCALSTKGWLWLHSSRSIMPIDQPMTCEYIKPRQSAWRIHGRCIHYPEQTSFIAKATQASLKEPL